MNQQRTCRKVGTAIITSFTAFHTVFRVDYGEQEHVFTGLQTWYKRKVDEILLGGGGGMNGQKKLEDHSSSSRIISNSSSSDGGGDMNTDLQNKSKGIER